MNKREKVIWALIGATFAIVFLLVFGSYLAADEQRVATIAIEDVPHNAVEDASVKNQSIYWKGNVYKPEELKSIMISDINYFNVDPMDSIKFSIGYRNDAKYTGMISTVFIRGVRYSKLPFVYDYEGGIDLEPADVVFVYGLILYDLEEFKVSKNPPWVINAKYQKIGLFDVMLISVSFGFLASCGMRIMTLLVMSITTIITTKAVKKSAEEFEK